MEWTKVVHTLTGNNISSKTFVHYVRTYTDGTTKYRVLRRIKSNGEEVIQKHCEKYYIARTSWLYGHHGRNFVETMISLAEQKELKVVDDQVGCPTWTIDLSDAIINLIEDEAEYGIYHTCGGGSTSWYGFAKQIFEYMGIKANLIPCSTGDFPRKAKRPSQSVMDNENRLRDWKLALKEYKAFKLLLKRVKEYIELRID